jgi:hypothetical protein
MTKDERENQLETERAHDSTATICRADGSPFSRIAPG